MTAIAEETEQRIVPLNFAHKDDLPWSAEDEREYQDGVAREQEEAWLDFESMSRR